MEQLLNISDVSEWLKVRQSTLRAWIFQKRLPVVRVGRLIRFKPSDIEKWLKDQEGRG